MICGLQLYKNYVTAAYKRGLLPLGFLNYITGWSFLQGFFVFLEIFCIVGKFARFCGVFSAKVGENVRFCAFLMGKVGDWWGRAGVFGDCFFGGKLIFWGFGRFLGCFRAFLSHFWVVFRGWRNGEFDGFVRNFCPKIYPGGGIWGWKLHGSVCKSNLVFNVRKYVNF